MNATSAPIVQGNKEEQEVKLFQVKIHGSFVQTEKIEASTEEEAIKKAQLMADVYEAEAVESECMEVKVVETQKYVVNFSGRWNYSKTVTASSEEEAIDMAEGFDTEDVEVDLRYDYVEAEYDD